MFASRLDYQTTTYVAWRAEPQAMVKNAFTLNWHYYPIYASPGFSLITPVLQKIEMDLSEEIIVVSQWIAQSWYSLLARILIEKPLLLPQRDNILYLPFNRDKRHPFGKNLKLMSCRFIMSALQNQVVSQSAHARIHPHLLEPWNPEKISNLLEQMARLYLRTICQSVKPFHLPVNKDLDFLLKLYEQDLGGPGINTARCALSSLITLEGNMTIGKHLLVQRFIKGVF